MVHLGPFQALDGAATRDAVGSKMTISVVNRHPDAVIPTEIVLRNVSALGTATIRTVAHNDRRARSDFENADEVGVSEGDEAFAGPRVELEFPARSLSVITVGGERNER